MLDPKFVRQNVALVKENLRRRGLAANLVDHWLAWDQKRRRLEEQLQELRAERNKARARQKAKPSQKDIEKARRRREEIQKKEKKLRGVMAEWEAALRLLPNMAAPDVPTGKSAADNVVVRQWREKPKFSFPPQDYLTLAERLGIIDVKNAGKISGPRFGFLVAEGALLELALIEYSFHLALKNGFVPIIPPVLLKKQFEAALGYGEHGGWDDMYVLEKDNLVLTATTEHALVARHADDLFAEKDLPRRYVGFSSAFRREAGSYGRDTRGIFRVHQFDQTEFISFTRPEDSDREQEFLVGLEEELMQGLKLPYRVVKMCSADLAQPQWRRYDLEVWLPGQKQYRETHSASNCTDYQARRLNIRFRRRDGRREYVHILNATGLAIGRTIIAILENYQQKDGSVVIPEVLQKWVGKEKIKNEK